MNAILTAAFIGLVVGFFLLFGISPMEFTEGIFTRILAKPNSIKSQINEATKRKKAECVPQRNIRGTGDITTYKQDKYVRNIVRLFAGIVGDRNLRRNRNRECVSRSRNGGGAHVCTFLVRKNHCHQLQKSNILGA